MLGRHIALRAAHYHRAMLSTKTTVASSQSAAPTTSSSTTPVVHASPDRNAPGSVALSWLPPSPTRPAAAVIGWIPAASVPSGSTVLEAAQLPPASFRANPAFVSAMHSAVAKHAHHDPELVALAEHQGEGWMHVADARCPPSWGRIPDADDIIGSVQLVNKTMVPGSYQRMPSHRLVSAHGLVVLSPFLHVRVLEALAEGH
ncbi:hypothetical protein BC828DRAFT_372872 [Blastocladiella britannica]|nr:hypothetical protein BC828DRAFT_372872 [Blastocladiella britannica]